MGFWDYLDCRRLVVYLPRGQGTVFSGNSNSKAIGRKMHTNPLVKGERRSTV